MSVSPRRAIASAVLLALACAVPGLPAVASSATGTTSVVMAPAPDTFEVEKTGGLTQLSDTAQVEDAGKVLYDTRQGHGAFGAREVRVLDIVDGGPVTAPADATAAILHITAVSPTSSGWLTAWPSDHSQPATSTLNFVPGTPTPNLAIVQLTSSRALKVFNGSSGTTHVLVSLRGWVRSNGGVERPGSFTATDATRVIDTRQSGPAVPARGYRDVEVSGVGAPTGASAAALSVIAVNPSQGGYLIAHPSDTARPTSTALTFRVGAPRAALSVMRLSSTGKVRVWNMSSAPVHLVVDSFGWVTPGDSTSTPAGLQAISPVRTLDTRVLGGALRPASPSVQVPVPGDDLSQYEGRPSGVVLAITATGATASGYLRFNVADLTTDPLGSMLTPSVLNFGRGETVTNTTYVTVPNNGRIWLQAETTGQVHAIVDVVGVVRPRVQLEGRLVTEGANVPVYPAEVTASPGGARLTGTRADGTYRMSRNTFVPTTGLCGRSMTTSGPDLSYAVACLGGSRLPTSIPVAVGTRIRAGDILVPRVGALTGAVTLPSGSPTPTTARVTLQRSDGKYASFATLFSAPGTWRVERLPVGEWVVSVSDSYSGLSGETIDEIPFIAGSSELGATLSAGAKTFTVAPGATTTVDEVQLKAKGALRWTIVDPDGNYSNVQYSVRHESGYVIYAGPQYSGEQYTRMLRPGGYTVCATEGTVTRCNDGATSAADAPLLAVVSGTDPGISTTITLP